MTCSSAARQLMHSEAHTHANAQLLCGLRRYGTLHISCKLLRI